MKNVKKLSGGYKVEVTQGGLEVTFKNGKVVTFDKEGEIIDTSFILEKPEWFEYFFLMGKKERKTVKTWLKKQKAETFIQKNFLEYVEKALEKITYDYRIATIEPSRNYDGEIYYDEGKYVYVGLSCNEWEKKAKSFAPVYNSQLADVYELFLWYAYRIAKGYWSLSFVCDNSSYKQDGDREFLASGSKEFGGFSDGLGNTYKIVKHPVEKFWICGASYREPLDKFPVIHSKRNMCDTIPDFGGTGWIVLKGKNI